ncbi:MAG: hypothetical protein K2Y05_07970 [Hyphomicrobiaceae bacterium]|nr:hypothetical protein [Hyphomicrobiaceae bacterium]
MTVRTSLSAVTLAAMLTLMPNLPMPFAELLGASPASAQRGPGLRGIQGNWELLGEAQVAFRRDNDIIPVARDEDFYRNKSYRRLRLVIDGGDVRLRNIRVVYLNGHVEDLPVARTLSEGEEFIVDLKGERSYLKQVELSHRGRLNFSFGPGGLRIGTPTVRVFGENVRQFTPPPPPPPVVDRRPPTWQSLADERFDRRDDKVVLAVGRREGRLGQIALKHQGEPVLIREVRIRFGNGDIQEAAIDRRLRDGDQTAPIDLQGDRRFIEQVTVILDPRQRGGNARLTLLGIDRPGNEGPRADGPGRLRETWVPLGRQAVSLRLDRDTIEIATPADGPRAKSFDKLHFVAENNDLMLGALRVTYLNGYVEDIPVGRAIRMGDSLTVDLPGRRSYLRRVEMVYSARPGFDGTSMISIFGERIGRE